MANPFADSDSESDGLPAPAAPARASPAPSRASAAPPAPPRTSAPPSRVPPSPPPPTPSYSPPDEGAPSGRSGAGTDFRDPVTGMVHSKKAMDRRERELADRERELATIEEQIRTGAYKPKRNFPPFLGWWAWHPEKDLPVDVQPGMRKLRWLFIGITLAYAVNLIGVLTMIGCKYDSDGDGKDEVYPVDSLSIAIVLAVFFLIVLCPFSFKFVFFYLYKAFQRGRTIRFFVALGFYIIWFLVLAFNLVGIQEAGSVGFIVMGFTFRADKPVAGVVCLIFIVLGVVCAVGMVLAFFWLWRYYRQNGLAGKAKEEAAGLAIDYAREHPDQAAAVAGAAAGKASGA